ncbi:MAG: hypothetical protein RLY61_385 [Candidatus Parcubacteria bacterium]|jgi:hypothetical protein
MNNTNHKILTKLVLSALVLSISTITTPSSTAAGLPNLTISSVEPMVEENLVKVTLLNNGTVPVRGQRTNFRVKVTQNSTSKTITIKSKIEPSSSLLVKVPFTVSTRDTIKVQVDPNKVIRESNETDNIFSYEFPALPEFTGRVFTTFSYADPRPIFERDETDPHNYNFRLMKLVVSYNSPVPLKIQSQLALDKDGWEILDEVPTIVSRSSSDLNTNFDGVNDTNLFKENLELPATTKTISREYFIKMRIKSIDGSYPISYPVNATFSYKLGTIDEKVLEVSEVNSTYASTKSRPINVELYKLDTGESIGDVELWYFEDKHTNLATWGVGKAAISNMPVSPAYSHIQMSNEDRTSTRGMESVKSNGVFYFDVLDSDRGLAATTYPLPSAHYYTKVVVKWQPNYPTSYDYAFWAEGTVTY